MTYIPKRIDKCSVCGKRRVVAGGFFNFDYVARERYFVGFCAECWRDRETFNDSV